MKSWSILAWEPIVASVGSIQINLVHMHSQAVTSNAGQTSWYATLPHGVAAIAWDWARLRENVLVVADPLRILTNAVFVNNGGVEIDSSQLPGVLNTLVHGLPWQRYAARALRASATCRTDDGVSRMCFAEQRPQGVAAQSV
jgi:hypothetical protein